MKPRLRFNYNENYSYELFKDVFQIKNNNSFSREELKAFGNFKNIHYGDIHTKLNKITDVQSTELPYIDQNNEVKLTELCNDYDILIADASEDYADIGKCIQLINVKNCVAGLHTILARPKYKSLYLTHLLSSWYVRKQFMKLACGAKVLGLSKSSLQKVVLPFPKIEEQTKIATFLNLYYKKIELQKKKIDLLHNMFKWVAKINLDINKEEMYIENLVEEFIEKSHSENQYPVLSSTMNGVFLQNEYFTDNVITQSNIGYKIVPYNYFTYRSMSDTGKFVFNIQRLVDKGIVSPAYPVFNVNEKCLSDFLYYYLNYSKYIKKQLLLLKEGGTRYALGFEKFKKLKVVCLTLEEQQVIVKNLDLIKSKLELEKQKLEAMEKYKHGLLQQLFI